MIRCYRRVSTEEQGDSGAGLFAQTDTLTRRYRDESEGQTLEWYEEVASAKDLDRPELTRLLAEIEPGDVLAVAKLDRLSRSVGDFADLLQTAEKEGWSIVALDLGVDTTTPTGRLVANVMISVAQWEREIIGQRTKEALASRKANGVTLGRPVEVSNDVEWLVLKLHNEGLSLAEIADRLELAGHSPARSDAWSRSSVAGILARAKKED